MPDEVHQRPSFTQSGYFDDNSQRYQFCSSHVRTWAMVIGTFELIGNVIQLFGAIVTHAMRNQVHSLIDELVDMIISIVGFVISMVVILLLIHGIKNEKYLFLIPHLVVQILSIIGCILLAIIYFIVVGNVARLSINNENETGMRAVLIRAFVLLIAALFEMFFFYVIYRCYEYLKEKKFALGTALQVPMA